MKHMVRGIVCLAVVAGVSFTASATTYRVTPDATGGGNGQAWADDGAGNAPMTFAEAIAVAQKDDVVLCKAGLYETEAPFAISRAIEVRGGLAGTDDTTLHVPSSTSVFKITLATIPITANYPAVYVTTKTSADDQNVFVHCTFSGGYFNNQWRYNSGLLKEGKASIRLESCEFCGNRINQNGLAGVGLRIVGTAETVATLENCIFHDNVTTSANGMGFGLYAESLKELVLTDCLFTRNGLPWSTNLDKTINADSAGMSGTAMIVSGAKVTATGCRFLGNRHIWGSKNSGGGTILLQGNCDGSLFENCLFLGNLEMFGSTQNWNLLPQPSDIWGTGVLTLNLAASEQKVSVRRCTFAYNLATAKISGTAITVRKGTLDLSESILFGNKKASWGAAGAELALGADGFANVTDTLITDGSEDSITTAVAGNLSLSAKFGDPLFVTPHSDFEAKVSLWQAYGRKDPYFLDVDAVENFDVHTKSPAGYYTRATYDADPVLVEDSTAPVSPAIEFGNYVGTDEATVKPVGGQPAISSVAVTFPDGYTRPSVAVTLGSETPGAVYQADVTVSVKVGGAVVASGKALSLANGDTAVISPAVYFDPGTALTIEVLVTAEGADDVSESETTSAQGEKPIWVGHGGGANVVHVRAGADGKQDGTNWENAYATLAQGVSALTAERNELWIMGDLAVESAVTIDPVVSTIIRGGFDGHEDSADERVSGVKTVIDANYSSKCLVLTVGEAKTVTIERIDFEKGKDGCFQKTGAGNLNLLSCHFANGKFVESASAASGIGASMSGTAESELVISNCVFEANYSRQGSAGNGIGLSLANFGDVRIVDSAFVDNGLGWGGASLQNSVSKYGASALHVAHAPVKVVRCVFRGNRAATRENCGGTVRLSGACGGSEFVNCCFVGNMETFTAINNPSQDTYLGLNCGIIRVELEKTEDAVTIDNCTLSCNYLDSPRGAAIVVAKGTANVKNTVAYGNYRWASGPTKVLADLEVREGGVANVSYSIFSADANTGTSMYVVDGGILRYNEGTQPDVVFADPLFVTPADTIASLIKRSGWGTGYEFLAADYDTVLGFNVHLRGGTGYTDERTGEVVKDWTRRRYGSSPAIDAGDPAVRCVEPHPNGCRVNMGFYGNTEWATMSRDGLLIFVK